MPKQQRKETCSALLISLIPVLSGFPQQQSRGQSGWEEGMSLKQEVGKGRGSASIPSILLGSLGDCCRAGPHGATNFIFWKFYHSGEITKFSEKDFPTRALFFSPSSVKATKETQNRALWRVTWREMGARARIWLHHPSSSAMTLSAGQTTARTRSVWRKMCSGFQGRKNTKIKK